MQSALTAAERLWCLAIDPVGARLKTWVLPVPAQAT